MPAGIDPIGHPRQRPVGHPSGSPIPGMACPKRPQHTWYAGTIAHRNPTAPLNQAVTGSPTRSGYTPDFGLFPPATGCCRILTFTDNHQKARSRPLPASAVARRVWALRVPKDTPNYTNSLRAPLPRRAVTSCGRLRLSRNHHEFAAEEKAPGATPAPPGRRTAELRTPEVRPFAPPLPGWRFQPTGTFDLSLTVAAAHQTANGSNP